MLHRLRENQLRDIVSLRVDGMTEHDRDEMAIPSYLHANPLIRWLMWRRYEKIAELAALDKSMSVLEFGCGVGLFLPTLASRCAKVTAIDLFPQYAKRLAEKLNLQVDFIGDVSMVADASLDCIIAADVLEHLDEPAGYLELFRNKLKPGGALVVSGPTENIVYRIGRLIAGFGDKGDYHHTNIDLLIPMIVAAGFKPERCSRLPFSFSPVLFKVCSFTRPV
jgi:2-polyprenyl-3-methyl-5-hydroxy-6-metoxy-1,4-benzoquinol methylase